MHIVAMIAAFQIKDTKGGLLACDTDMLKMKRVMQLEHRRGGENVGDLAQNSMLLRLPCVRHVLGLLGPRTCQ